MIVPDYDPASAPSNQPLQACASIARGIGQFQQQALPRMPIREGRKPVIGVVTPNWHSPSQRCRQPQQQQFPPAAKQEKRQVQLAVAAEGVPAYEGQVAEEVAAAEGILPADEVQHEEEVRAAEEVPARAEIVEAAAAEVLPQGEPGVEAAPQGAQTRPAGEAAPKTPKRRGRRVKDYPRHLRK